MPETFAQYRKRILGYLGERDPIRIQRRTPARLERLVADLPRRLLTPRPAPGRWSVLEVIHHMADAELAMGWRLRNMLATPGLDLPWWDQDLWATRLGYAERRPGPALALFRALREGNLALLLGVPRRRWATGYGVHEVRGRQTVAEFVAMEAAHDLAHIRQIRITVEALRQRRAGPVRSTGRR